MCNSGCETSFINARDAGVPYTAVVFVILSTATNEDKSDEWVNDHITMATKVYLPHAANAHLN